jgi:hypothetical protein
MMNHARWLLLVLAAGCATTSQQTPPVHEVQRLTLQYSNGENFDLQHVNAAARVFDPLRPHDISDGVLSGQLCGTPMQYDARWSGGTLTIAGSGDIRWDGRDRPMAETTLILGISEPAPGRRRIAGAFGGHVLPEPSSPIVDLDVSADELQGRIGSAQFALVAKGDYLVGDARDGSARPGVPFAIYGRNVLPTMAPADEGLALVGMLTCNSSVVEYEKQEIRGFALVRLDRKGTIPEIDTTAPVAAADDDDDEVEPPPWAGIKRTIAPANAAETVNALREYKDRPVVVYLPRHPTDEMRGVAASLVDILTRTGMTVDQQSWTVHSCRPPAYDLSLIASHPPTPLEMAVGVRLTLTKLHVYVCQSANADADKIGVLVLPPHQGF